MDGASAELLSIHGEKTMQAVSAFFNEMCPGLGGIVIVDPTESVGGTDISGNITDWEIGSWIELIEQADLSCDETKAGFQIHISHQSWTKSLDDVKMSLKSRNR